MQVDQTDLAYLYSLRELGILEDVARHRLPARTKGGTQIVSCADSDQFNDIYQRHIHLSGCSRCAPLNHYGGALVIPSHSPASALGQSELVKDQLFLGYALGKGDVQVHVSHFPCGVAAGYGLSARACLMLLCDARDDALDFFQKRIENIANYLENAAHFDHMECEQICLATKLPLREVLAIQRVVRCSSIETLQSIVMPSDDTVLSHFHINWENDKRRTYHLNRKRFKEFAKTQRQDAA